MGGVADDPDVRREQDPRGGLDPGGHLQRPTFLVVVPTVAVGREPDRRIALADRSDGGVDGVGVVGEDQVVGEQRLDPRVAGPIGVFDRFSRPRLICGSHLVVGEGDLRHQVEVVAPLQRIDHDDAPRPLLAGELPQVRNRRAVRVRLLVVHQHLRGQALCRQRALVLLGQHVDQARRDVRLEIAVGDQFGDDHRTVGQVGQVGAGIPGIDLGPNPLDLLGRGDVDPDHVDAGVLGLEVLLDAGDATRERVDHDAPLGLGRADQLLHAHVVEVTAGHRIGA